MLKVEKTRGGQKGNRNAAKVGEFIRFELFLSKTRSVYLAEWFEMKFGFTPNEEQLKEAARQLAYNAIDSAIIQEFERVQPGRIWSSAGEVF